MADMQAAVTLKLIDKLTGQISKPRQGFNNLRRSANELERQFRGLDTTSGHMSSGLKQKINQATQAIKKQSVALRELGQRYKQTASNMKTSGLMDAAGGVGLFYGGKKMAETLFKPAMQAARLEAAMDKLAAISNIEQNNTEYNALEKKARELGASTTFSGIEVVAGMQYQAMAGLTPKQILQAIKPTLDLAKATDTDLATTSDHITNIMSSFKLDWNQTSEVADLLAFSTTKANVNLIELAETVKYAGAMANTAGVKLDHVAAITGYLGDQGIKASMAGTHTRSIIRRLAAPPTEAKKALDELGVSTVDKKGNVRELLSIFKDLNETTKDLGSAKKINIFNKIGGAIGGGSLDKLVSGIDGVETKLKIIQNGYKGAAAKQAKKMSDNLIGDIQELGSAFEELQNTLGGALQKDLRSVAQSLTTIVNSFAAWGKNNESWVKGITATAGGLAAVVAALGIGKIGVGVTKFALSPLISSIGKISNIKAKRLEKVAEGLTAMSNGLNSAKPGKIRGLAMGVTALTTALNPWNLAIVGAVAGAGLYDWLGRLPEPHEAAAEAAGKHREALAGLGGQAKMTAEAFRAMTQAEQENRLIELEGLAADLGKEKAALGRKLRESGTDVGFSWGGRYSNKDRFEGWAETRGLEVTEANRADLEKLYAMAVSKPDTEAYADALRRFVLNNPDMADGLAGERTLVQDYLKTRKAHDEARENYANKRQLLKSLTPELPAYDGPDRKAIEKQIDGAFDEYEKLMEAARAEQMTAAAANKQNAAGGPQNQNKTTHIGPVTINNNGIGTKEAGETIARQIKRLEQNDQDSALYDFEDMP